MIPISFNSVPIEYVRFIQKFRKKIQGWYTSGVMGNAKAKIYVCQDCKLFFKLLLSKDHLKTIMTAKASDLPRIIEIVESKFPQLKNDREHPNDEHSELYTCLCKAFNTLGYSDPEFPNYIITKSLDLKACPYCNQVEIYCNKVIAEDDRQNTIKDSELDHFYPKSRVPYLAVSLFNLVPSCSTCNGGNGKHTSDIYAERLVNPFTLKNANGLEFKLDIVGDGLLNIKTFNQACDIQTITNDQTLVPNRKIFKIKGRYKNELDRAKDVWISHKKIESKGYIMAVSELSEQIGEEINISQWLNHELHIDSSNYNNAKLSKFVMDIWKQLDDNSL
jgi:hypothetical protein